MDFHSSDVNQVVVYVRVDMDMMGQAYDTFEAVAKVPLIMTFAFIVNVEPAAVHVASVTPLFQPATRDRRTADEIGVNVIMDIQTVASSAASITALVIDAFGSGALVEALTQYGLEVSVVLNAMMVEESPTGATDDVPPADDYTGEVLLSSEGGDGSKSPATIIVSVTGVFFGGASLVVLWLLKQKRNRVGLVKIGL